MQLDLPIIVGEPVPILYIEMDGTGVPVVRKETAGRPGKLDGWPAHTREVKLGGVFTQTKWDAKGFPLRAPDSTTYTPSKMPSSSASGSTSRLGNAVGAEQKRRSSLATAPHGSGTSPRSTFPAPSKSSIFSTRASTCGTSHACSTPTTPSAAINGSACLKNDGSIKARLPSWPNRCANLPVSDAKIAKKLRNEAAYFATNAARMNYPLFRKQPLFVGSGVIEAGCKSVVGHRLKQSGMFWTVNGANSILALRRCHLNARFEDYWEGRRAA